MKKVGILGGGQLGRMLLQEAANYPVETFVLENDPGCPAAHLCHHFQLGSIKDYDTVLEFGKQVLALIPLILPLCFLLLLWFIRAGPGRRFRLSLWHDANLHKKRLYYQLSLK